MPSRHHFAIVTQVYPPDPAAVGQHLADVAQELGRRGCKVTVLTSDRGYDDPSVRFARSEAEGNVVVLRLPFSSFGKASIGSRLLSGLSLIVQSTLIATFDRQLTDVLVSTIPHLAGSVGIGLKLVRSLKFHYWLMDLNPDQIVELGKLRNDSLPVKLFEVLNRSILRHATTITTLDENMARKFARKSMNGRHINVIAPWAAQRNASHTATTSNQFRARFCISNSRIVMHAGNHSAVHPLETLIEAVRALGLSKLHFIFVGGGVGKARIEQWIRDEKPQRVTALPYQPRHEIDALLSAADVHVVSVGNGTVGIVHPSKVYGALAAGRPVLVLGPRESPAAQIVLNHGVGWHVEHGDLEGALGALRDIDQMSDSAMDTLKHRALTVSATRFSRSKSIGEFCDLLLETGT